MAGKGKKVPVKAQKPIVDQANIVKKVDSAKEDEMNRIMTGINSMDLDN